MAKADFYDLYPELVPPGRLAQLLQDAIMKIDSPLVVEDPLGPSYSCLAVDDCSCQIMVAERERKFHTDFWRKGVLYGGLWTKDVLVLVRAIHLFLVERSSLNNLEKKFPQAEIPQSAYAHEQSRLVEFTWSHWHDGYWPDWPEKELAQVLAIASTYPRLRALLPYTSLNRVCFSTTTGFPYTRECPVIEVMRNQDCVVYDYGPRDNMKQVFKGPLSDAVAIAASSLSETIGAAVDGTAEDIAKSA